MGLKKSAVEYQTFLVAVLINNHSSSKKLKPVSQRKTKVLTLEAFLTFNRIKF